MAKRDARFFFLIHQRYLDDKFDIGRGRDILDMLRYDRAIVKSNPPTGVYLFSSLRGAHRGPVGDLPHPGARLHGEGPRVRATVQPGV